MTRRRLGRLRVTAVGPVLSVAARTRRSLTRPAGPPGAGSRGGFRQDVASHQDIIVVTALPEAVR
jgi:hypothetical protein